MQGRENRVTYVEGSLMNPSLGEVTKKWQKPDKKYGILVWRSISHIFFQFNDQSINFGSMTRRKQQPRVTGFSILYSINN